MIEDTPIRPIADRLVDELSRHPGGTTVAVLAKALDVDGGTVRKVISRYRDRFIRNAAPPGRAARWWLADGSQASAGLEVARIPVVVEFRSWKVVPLVPALLNPAGAAP